MSSSINDNIKFTIYGESHGCSVGIVIDNFPCGKKIDMDFMRHYMSRRAPKKDGTSTFRSETDEFEIQSGILNDTTTGTPISVVIKNKDTRSGDYENVKTLARPGHADYTGYIRFNGCNDVRGGGHFSGRLTAPLVFLGGLCSQVLNDYKITVGAHILSVKDIYDDKFDEVNLNKYHLIEARSNYLPVLNPEADEKMRNEIRIAQEKGDSVGGIVECGAVGVPAGIGSPMFMGLENRISNIIFGIPAVKGIEFGAGFDCVKKYGSENNDEFYIDGAEIKTKTNNHGGILGGISSGMPLILRAAFKPTPSISIQQNTIDYKNNTQDIIQIKGRHDPCIVPRAVVCVESAVNIAILNALLDNK